MKRFIPICCILFIGLSAKSQKVQLLRQVTAAAGGNALVNKTIIQYSIGEPVILTLSVPKLMLTQGFQQPEETGNAPLNEPVIIKSLIVFPNPATTQTKVEFDLLRDTKVVIQLVNNGGQTLRSLSFDMLAGKISYPLSLNGFASGLYYVVVKAGIRNYTEKLVIQ